MQITMQRRLLASFAASLLASGLLAACGGSDDSESVAEPFRGSYTVVLRTGQPTQIGTENMTLELLSVADSRCPIDALCVWEGHGAVTLRVSQTGQAAETVTIGLPAPAGRQLPGDGSYRGFKLSLQLLDPAPRAAAPTPVGDYRATVVVQRGAAAP